MQNYGLAHVWAQGDFVTRGIALALVIMSVLSWTRDRHQGLERDAPEAPHEERRTGVLAFGRFRRRRQEARRRLVERRRTIRSSRSRCRARKPPIIIIRRSRICTTAWTCRTGSRAA